MPGAEINLGIVGIGVDLEEVAPFREKDMDKDRRFFERLFSPEEITYCQRHRDSAPFFTARFCAKEALVKAARSLVNLQVTESEVAKTDGGAPYFKVRSSREDVITFFENYEPHLSLTHTKDHASAFVVLVQKTAKK